MVMFELTVSKITVWDWMLPLPGLITDLPGACWDMLLNHSSSTTPSCNAAIQSWMIQLKLCVYQIKHGHFHLTMQVQSGKKSKAETLLFGPVLTSCGNHVGMDTLPSRLSLWSPPDTRHTSAAWATHGTEWGQGWNYHASFSSLFFHIIQLFAEISELVHGNHILTPRIFIFSGSPL